MYFAASNGVGTTKGSWEQSFVLIIGEEVD